MPSPLILVVDDTPINCAVASMMLSQAGCRVVTVDSGAAALEAIRSQSFDMVLMDVQMPAMDGLEATVQIRQALGPGRRLPIIAHTAHCQAEERERCRTAGLDDFLAKPLQSAALRAILARWTSDGPAPSPETFPVLTPDGTVAVLDLTALRSFDRLRPGSSAILLGIYLKDLTVVETAIERAVADGDLTAVGRLTHKVKGASLTVGACAAGAAMRRLGESAGSGSMSACNELWPLVKTILADTRAAIADFLAGTAASPWPTHRATPEVLAVQRARVQRSEGLVACMDAMAGPALLLNNDRQIVSANCLFQRLLGVDDASTLVGKRPGEALGCNHASEGPDGCGSAPACSFCGAVQSVMTCLHNQSQAVTEARLTVGADTGHAFDLEMTATPIRLDEHSFVLVAMRDIAEEKKRKVLERIFFHDVLNSAGGILGLANLFAQQETTPAVDQELRLLLAQSSRQLVDEIEAQRLLSNAESGELQLDLQTIEHGGLLREVRNACIGHPVAQQRTLRLATLATATVRTDRVLFRRVLGNLVKNALEATPPGGTVTISSQLVDGAVRCTVHNPGEIPPSAQLQLFQRSFTTKGEGRGLGTWSAKLLGERYLGGRITFASAVRTGTEMVFTLPVAAA